MNPEIKEAIKLLTLYVVKEIDLREMNFSISSNVLTIRVLTKDLSLHRVHFGFEMLNEFYYAGKLENYINSAINEIKSHDSSE